MVVSMVVFGSIRIGYIWVAATIKPFDLKN